MHFSRFAFLLCFLPLLSPAYAGPLLETGKLSLSAEGETKLTPDQATITLSVVTQRKQAAEALQQNSKDMADAIKAIKDFGIEGKDIQTSSVSIQPQYAYMPNTQRRLTGYEARNAVTVVIKKLDQVGGVLDKAVTLGVNEVNGPYFGLQDKSKALESARQQAMEKIRALAKLYEDGMKIKLGRILQISESSTMPVQSMAAAASMEMMKAPDSAPAPVEAGEMTVTVHINAIWEIVP